MPVNPLAVLTPNSVYEYVYKTGEFIRFRFDWIGTVPGSLIPHVFGIVYASTRKGVPVNYLTGRIAKHQSLDESRLTLLASAPWPNVDSMPIPRVSKPATVARCAEDSHRPVDVSGFPTQIHLVCKVCDEDLGNGTTERKRAVGFRD